MKNIKVSPEFKSQATKSIVSIVIFIITYILLLAGSVLLILYSMLFAFLLISNSINFFTIIVGIGLASLGITIFSFLIKFLFKSHKIDRSHLKEITEKEQPELFSLIKEVVKKVDTDFPKKIYFSAEVNASVFYDSSFLSMFFPIKKNLMIGLGLINTVTKEELKAIIAHEFGHFSQRSMKLGSYVYYVNQVIFNLLYENDEYDKTLNSWGNISSFLAFFALVALWIVRGIQWVLGQMYGLVNKNYLALSREMEFHADQIAANVTGYRPLADSLMRMQLSDYALNAAFNYYGEKIAENKKSNNIFIEQSFVMNLLAKKSKLTYLNSLPQVSFDDLNKFNKSKLNIKDQWASHPSTEERIEKLKNETKWTSNQESSIAIELIHDLDKIQEELTNKAFNLVEYQGEVTKLSFETFSKDYEEQLDKNTFPEIYNNYYDDKNPVTLGLENINTTASTESLEELFSDEKVDLNYQTMALSNDIEVLTFIKKKEISVKSFDYDGKKYKRKQSGELITRLTKESENLLEKVKQNDENIYSYFVQKEKKLASKGTLRKLYQDFFDLDKTYEEKAEVYTSLSNELQFINLRTDYDVIRSNFKKVKALEFKLKKELQSLISNDKYKEEITVQIKENLDKYLAEDLPYFGNSMYFDNNLTILFTALQDYIYLLMRGYFITKKELLTYQENILKKNT